MEYSNHKRTSLQMKERSEIKYSKMSWKTLIYGGFYPLYKRDFIGFILVSIIQSISALILLFVYIPLIFLVVGGYFSSDNIYEGYRLYSDYIINEISNNPWYIFLIFAVQPIIPPLNLWAAELYPLIVRYTKK